MPDWIYVVIALELIIILIFGYAKKKVDTAKKDSNEKIVDYPYKKRTLLTEAEKVFFIALKEALPKEHIFAKVRLWDIIDSTKNEYKYTNKIQSKHIDFLLTDENYIPQIAIELDDKSHENARRKNRDEFLKKALEKAEISLLRIKVQKEYTIESIQEKIATSTKK